MGDFQSEMSGQGQMEMFFFGVEPSNIMARIIWSEERCRRLHSQLPSHSAGQELYSHHSGYSLPVYEPSCRKYISLGDMLDNCMESERLEAPWANDDRDIIMAQLIRSERGCELAHPGLWRHPVPYIHPTVPCIRNSGS